jgi:VanZ family protein
MTKVRTQTARTWPGSVGRRRVLIALIVYGLACLVIWVWPTSVDAPIDDLLDSVLRHLWQLGVPDFFDYSFVEFSANVLVSVPLGFAGVLLLPPKRWWVSVVIWTALSTAIESFQTLFLPGREGDIRDVIAAFIGAALGTLIALWVSARHRAAPAPE